MSEITANIVVETSNVNIQVEQSEVGVTVEPINLNIYSGGFGTPGGNLGELQYNAGILAGIPNVTYTSGNLSLGNIANVKMLGGSNGQAIITDGVGNLTFANISAANTANFANFAGTANIANTATNANFANYAGNVTVSSQPNITSLGTLTGLTVNGTSNLGSSGNVIITGGTNGYFLQTDGTGNLTWAVGANATGNGTVAGANTQVQFNDGGTAFGANAGFTFNKITGKMSAPALSAPLVDLPYGIENVTLITAQTGSYNFDLISNSIRYTTSNASANLILNFRGNSTTSINTMLANGQSITGTYVMKTGSTAYGITSITVDGNSQTIKWVNGVQPFTYANAMLSYTFTIIKTSTTPTFDVLGSGTRYL